MEEGSRRRPWAASQASRRRRFSEGISAGGNIRIRTGLSGEIRTDGDLTINHDPLTGITECSLAKGQTVLFISDDAPVSPDFRPLDIDVMDAGRHWGGWTM